MSRANSNAQQRTLTLTEELEKLEQSITLTLQEIDHNFSRAHRIVTSSILPIVEQYAQHSKEVWEGSKFWKQFFESSANVSLSGYEEQSTQHDTREDTGTEESNVTTQTTLETSDSYETPSAQQFSTDSIHDIDLSNLTISPSHSTPRPTAKQKQKASATAAFADYPSPYEALKREVNSTTLDATEILQSDLPETPGRNSIKTEDIAMTPQSSPFLPQQPVTASRPSTVRKKTDPLLHRVLDRTYRVQATPLASTRFRVTEQPSKAAATPATAARPKGRHHLLDSTLSSSPDVAPPELHAEIFSSPQRKPRTPGVSVLTPARGKANQKPPTHTPGVWDFDANDDDTGFDDDDDDDIPFGHSPPKTIQFHVPQSRLLKTPAKEASRRIVDDLLTDAGIGPAYEGDDLDLTDDIDLGDYGANKARQLQMGDDGDASPSVVRKVMNIEDETF